MQKKYKLQKLNYLCSKELCYEMDPFIWELVKSKDGTTKVKIIEEDDKNKNWEKYKVLKEEDIIRIRNAGTFHYETEEEEDMNETKILTFEDKRRVIGNFYKNNLEILKSSNRYMLDIEKQNEKVRQAIEKGADVNRVSKFIRTWKFFRCTNGKLRIISGKWLLVAFNKKEIFWENIKRDQAKSELDCYEIRLAEIVNSFTDVTRKYWKNQKGIATRSRRTKLFKSDLFINRRSQKYYGYETFGNQVGSFAKKELSFVRNEMLRSAGNQIGGLDWREALLYPMASNGDYFGTGMMKYNEKQLYKKFMKVIEISPIARLDAELVFDIKFYARFLAIYLSKMKKDWIKIDKDRSVKGMKKASMDYKKQNILK
jgi:hypothetical protein